MSRSPLQTTSTRHPWTLAAGVFGLMLLATACVTINVYFPEAAVKDLSQHIEDAVAEEAERAAESPQATDGTAAIETPDAKQISLVEAANIAAGQLLRLLVAPTAYANEPVAAPEISNPAIRKIIESRGQRAPELRRLKSLGVLGENHQALVEIRDLAALDLKSRAAAQKLVKAENDDRQRMFKEIAAATGTDLSQLPQIQSTYATTLRQNAKVGDWIQSTAGGAWKQKS